MTKMTAIASVRIGQSRFMFADTLVSGYPKCLHSVDLPDRRVVVKQAERNAIGPISCTSKISICGPYVIAWAGDVDPAAAALSAINGLYDNNTLTYDAIETELHAAATPNDSGKSAAFLISYFAGAKMVTKAFGNHPVSQIYKKGTAAIAYGSGATLMLEAISGVVDENGCVKAPFAAEASDGMSESEALSAAYAVMGRLIGLNKLYNDAILMMGVGGVYEVAYGGRDASGTSGFRALDNVAYVIWELSVDGEMAYGDEFQQGKYAGLSIDPTCVFTIKYLHGTLTYLRARPCGCHERVFVKPVHKMPYEIDLGNLELEASSTDWTPRVVVDVFVDRWAKSVSIGIHENTPSSYAGRSSSEPSISVTRGSDEVWHTRLHEGYCNELAEGFVKAHVRDGVTVQWRGGYSFRHRHTSSPPG